MNSQNIFIIQSCHKQTLRDGDTKFTMYKICHLCINLYKNVLNIVLITGVISVCEPVFFENEIIKWKMKNVNKT